MGGRKLLKPLVLLSGVLLALAVSACGDPDRASEAPLPGADRQATVQAQPTLAPAATPAATEASSPALSTPTPTPVVVLSPAAPTPTVAPIPRGVGGNVGNVAPPFTLTLADGTTATVGSLAEPGKPLLLYFFATW